MLIDITSIAYADPWLSSAQHIRYLTSYFKLGFYDENN